METSIIINSTKDGKKYQKSIAKINPEKDNATLNEFAGMVNALSTNTFQGGSRVDKMSLSESKATGKQEGIISVVSGDSYSSTIQLAYNGDGHVSFAKIGENRISFDETTLTVEKIDDFSGFVAYALPTANYTAACLTGGFED